MPAHKSIARTRCAAPGREISARAPQRGPARNNAPVSPLRGLPPAHQAILRRYRAALPAQRREIFDRAVRGALADDPAIQAVGAAAARAYSAALSAAPAIPEIFRKEQPP
jgi:hypothetical protein